MRSRINSDSALMMTSTSLILMVWRMWKMGDGARGETMYQVKRWTMPDAHREV